MECREVFVWFFLKDTKSAWIEIWTTMVPGHRHLLQCSTFTTLRDRQRHTWTFLLFLPSCTLLWIVCLLRELIWNNNWVCMMSLNCVTSAHQIHRLWLLNCLNCLGNWLYSDLLIFYTIFMAPLPITGRSGIPGFRESNVGILAQRIFLRVKWFLPPKREDEERMEDTGLLSCWRFEINSSMIFFRRPWGKMNEWSLSKSCLSSRPMMNNLTLSCQKL